LPLSTTGAGWQEPAPDLPWARALLNERAAAVFSQGVARAVSVEFSSSHWSVSIELTGWVPLAGLPTGAENTVWRANCDTGQFTPVRTAGFEPAISCFRSRRNSRLSHVLIPERPAGVEPGTIRRMVLPPWQGGRLPLHHGRLVGHQVVKDHQSTGRDSNPRRRITKAVSSPLDHRCLLFKWDWRDLNPHPPG
jgi:hypothetical protein